MDFLLHPWPWYVAGPLIAFVLFLMFYFGKNFGVSTTLETFCTLSGANKLSDYFKIDLKKEKWRLFFAAGILLGGIIAANFLTPNQAVDLNAETVQEMANLGFADGGKTFLPKEIFSIDALLSFKGFLILIGSGFLIGFGSRYAGGCTSGHSITGLSSLQMPSLIATVGFFIGGLIMTWFLIPLIF
ncbi:YeeE/YedE family protein [Polaribacter sp.]|uniref:YeeE/YedE family protein n=1 Tax=Polaribacter sp. TaxID=1920175 RepID=UPI003F6AA2AA